MELGRIVLFFLFCSSDSTVSIQRKVPFFEIQRYQLFPDPRMASRRMGWIFLSIAPVTILVTVGFFFAVPLSSKALCSYGYTCAPFHKVYSHQPFDCRFFRKPIGC